ncbi:hypothetical protein FQN55_006979 [Onygenales sp. PD_40]|nr:hypothetical protein FQN55_006979 [Onygenales sp. PD_40]
MATPQPTQQNPAATTTPAKDDDNAQSAIPLVGGTEAPVHLPRVTIKYCTQCKWLLRAAYFAQELLSTFSTTLGEVSLIPTTGGIFTITILHSSNVDFSMQETVLWDRKTEGGFPETKQLKSLVRNVVDPSRDLGHVDRALAKKKEEEEEEEREGVTREDSGAAPAPAVEKGCKDCE